MLDRDDPQLGAVADDDLHVGAVLAGAGVVDDHGRAAVPAGLDHQVAVAATAEARDVDVHRLGQLGLDRDPDDRRRTRMGPGDSGDPVLRRERLHRVGGDALEHDTFGAVRVDLRGLGARLVGEESLERLHRGEAPLLLAAVRHREVGHVVRRGPLAACLQRHRGARPVRVALVAGRDQGFGG